MEKLSPADMTEFILTPLSPSLLSNRSLEYTAETPSGYLELRTGNEIAINNGTRFNYSHSLDPASARLMELLVKLPQDYYLRTDIIDAILLTPFGKKKAYNILSSQLSTSVTKLSKIAFQDETPILIVDDSIPRKKKLAILPGIEITSIGWKNLFKRR